MCLRFHFQHDGILNISCNAIFHPTKKVCNSLNTILSRWDKRVSCWTESDPISIRSFVHPFDLCVSVFFWHCIQDDRHSRWFTLESDLHQPVSLSVSLSTAQLYRPMAPCAVHASNTRFLARSVLFTFFVVFLSLSPCVCDLFYNPHISANQVTHFDDVVLFANMITVTQIHSLSLSLSLSASSSGCLSKLKFSK